MANDSLALGRQIEQAAAAHGFTSVAAVALDLDDAGAGLREWLAAGMHGDMQFMHEHAALRLAPQRLVPGALSALMFTMPYVEAQRLGDQFASTWEEIHTPAQGYVSLYARGRDYHKVVRQGLAALAKQLHTLLGPFGHRAFCDSAPVMEVELARRAGLGWRGKHTLMLNREAGSLFFLGSIYTDLPLDKFSLSAPEVPADGEHCGSCVRCIEVCPTQAIVAPYRLDARRCISYLTIELKGSIPVQYRALIGNRIVGCDDCQLVCPWNKYAQSHTVADFEVRSTWEKPRLLEAFAWTEEEFLRLTQGSAIRRIGHARWQRNVAVALGNLAASRATLAPQECTQVIEALKGRLTQSLAAQAQTEAMVKEHVQWALECWHGT